MQGFSVFVIGLAIWVFVLSLVLGWVFNYFRRLSKGVEKENLLRVLERVLVRQEEISKALKDIQKQVLELKDQERLHIQKVSIVRFNPFKEMGGDHSFSLALLDGNDTGFVITGLHTRERTRVYVKSVQRGKTDLELSADEKKALVQAQKS